MTASSRAGSVPWAQTIRLIACSLSLWPFRWSASATKYAAEGVVVVRLRVGGRPAPLAVSSTMHAMPISRLQVSTVFDMAARIFRDDRVDDQAHNIRFDIRGQRLPRMP